jgi:hypothetical protein
MKAKSLEDRVKFHGSNLPSGKSQAISVSKEQRMRRCKKIAICFFAILLLFFIAPGKGFSVSCVDSLKGLEGVEVLVEELKADLENYNLTALDIQTDVEAKLRAAGIKIFSKQENEKKQPLHKPYLYVKVNSYKPVWRKEVIAFHIEIALKQLVTIPPEHGKYYEKSFYAPTWYKSRLGVIFPRDIPKIRDAVSELTDKFIAAYLRENPKK